MSHVIHVFGQLLQLENLKNILFIFIIEEIPIISSFVFNLKICKSLLLSHFLSFLQ